MLEVFFAFVQLISLIFIFSFHNFVKAYVAYLLGDDTPKRMGFLTLNPIAHIDPVGSIILPLIFILARSPLIIGWPRMVPIDYNRLRNHRRDAILLSLVSIVSYFLIAFISYLLFKLIVSLSLPDKIVIPLASLFQYTTFISVFFGFLNLFPIPPLDMGIIVFLLLGKSMDEIQRQALIGGIVILFLFLLGFFSKLFEPVYSFLQRLF